MSLLSDRSLRRALEDGPFALNPEVADHRIQPASLEVTLGGDFWVYREVQFNGHTFPATAGIGSRETIDPELDNGVLMEKISVPAGGHLLLDPGGFALGGTVERITIPRGLAARVEGKSSLGRLGLGIHTTAGFIDPGFEGEVTLELWSVAPLPIVLRPGMPIGQLCLFELTTRAARPYGSPGLGSHYQGQSGPQPSRSHTTPKEN